MGHIFAVVPNSREKELYHFGIKGMKWGVRRFRNKDGSYTPAGKKRYSKPAPSHEYLLSSRDPDEIYKYRKYYSDHELQQRLNRLNTEENIYRKTSEAKRREKIGRYAKTAAKTFFVAGPSLYGAYRVYKNRKTKPYYNVKDGDETYTRDWKREFGVRLFNAGKRYNW